MLNEDQIKHMANRFLNWRLPEHFSPDAGISFDPVFNKGTQYEGLHQPTGTNLFGYDDAVAMVCHMAEGLPEEGEVGSEGIISLLRELLREVQQLRKELMTMDADVQTQLTNLQDRVAREDTVEQSAISLLNNLKTALDTALANSNTSEIVATIQGISDHLGSNTDALAAAVAANTPAAAPAPTPTPAPAPTPEPITVSPDAISGTAGQGVTATLSVSGGTSPYEFSSDLSDISVDASGNVSGTPAAAETGTITVTDSSSPALTASVSVTIS